MVKNNKNGLRNLIIVLVAFMVLTSFNGGKEGKKMGFGCSGSNSQNCGWVSNEPTFDNIDMNQMKTIVFNALGGIYNLTTTEGYAEGYFVKSICASYLNRCADVPIGIMFSRYNDTILTYIGPGWNITGQEFINQLIELPVNGQFITPDGNTLIKKRYAGQNYYVIQGLQYDLSGLYFNIQNNLFVVFYPRTQDEIIKSYLDTFYTYSCS